MMDSTPKRIFPIDSKILNLPSSKKRKTETVDVQCNNSNRKIPDMFKPGSSKMSNKINNDTKTSHVPLAERMRPKALSDYIGQNHLIGSKTLLHDLLQNGNIPSMILWGPPGCGKTSLVNVIMQESKKMTENPIKFIKLSATSASVNDIRQIVTEAQNHIKEGKRTVIFMDEIHRFNKLQQDIFLPHIEAGTFILIGATTENPSSSLNSALLSRCRVFILQKLSKDELVSILSKAVESDKQTNLIHQMHNALHHSILGDDDNAALYWLARIMHTGEDPVNIARKLVRIASEEICLTDDGALSMAVNTMHACEMIGMPECDVILAECVIYLARAEKSKEIINALRNCQNIVENHKGPQPKVPLFIKDTSAEKKLKVTLGANYKHLLRKENLNKSYLPEGLENMNFYEDDDT